MTPQTIEEVDPFDLPEWLGAGEVVWHSETGVRSGHLVRGWFAADGEDRLDCDLLAVDEAYPVPVIDEQSRHRAHQSWHHGQVLVGRLDGRLVLPVPGVRFDADRVLEALRRLSLAVGGKAAQMSVLMRLGDA